MLHTTITSSVTQETNIGSYINQKIDDTTTTQQLGNNNKTQPNKETFSENQLTTGTITKTFHDGNYKRSTKQPKQLLQ